MYKLSQDITYLITLKSEPSVNLNTRNIESTVFDHISRTILTLAPLPLALFSVILTSHLHTTIPWMFRVTQSSRPVVSRFLLKPFCWYSLNVIELKGLIVVLKKRRLEDFVLVEDVSGVFSFT